MSSGGGEDSEVACYVLGKLLSLSNDSHIVNLLPRSLRLLAS